MLRLSYLDLETHALAEGLRRPAPVLLSLVDEGEEPVLCSGGVARDLASARVGDPGVLVAAHNLPFDCAVMAAHWDLEVPILRMLADARGACTQVREKLLRIHTGEPMYRTGLAATIPRYFDASLEKRRGAARWRVNFGRLEGLPLLPGRPEGPVTRREILDFPPTSWYFDGDPEGGSLGSPIRPLDRVPLEAALYSLADTEWGAAVFLEQEILYQMLTGRGREDGIVDEGPQTLAAYHLHEMEADGLFSSEAAPRVLRELRHQRADLAAQVRAGGLMRADGSKNMAVVRAAVSEVLPDPPATPGGSVSTSRDTIEQAAKAAPGRVDALVAMSAMITVDKFISAYVEPFARGGRVHWRYDVLKYTGRTSSASEHLLRPDGASIKVGANVQNYPQPRAVERLARRLARGAA